MIHMAKTGLGLAYFMLVMGTGADPATAAFSSWLGVALADGVLSSLPPPPVG